MYLIFTTIICASIFNSQQLLSIKVETYFSCSLQDLQKDVAHLASKMAEGVQRGLLLRNENANAHYTTEFITNLFAEEGKDVFSCRQNVLGE